MDFQQSFFLSSLFPFSFSSTLYISISLSLFSSVSISIFMYVSIFYLYLSIPLSFFLSFFLYHSLYSTFFFFTRAFKYLAVFIFFLTPPNTDRFPEKFFVLQTGKNLQKAHLHIQLFLVVKYSAVCVISFNGKFLCKHSEKLNYRHPNSIIRKSSSYMFI